MSGAWTAAELKKIGEAEEIRIADEPDHGPAHKWVPIWVVRLGQGLYIRSGFGTRSAWYRHAAEGRTHVRFNGTEYQVTLELHADPVFADAVDEAYRQKYRDSSFLPSLISADARSTTSLLVPRR